MAANLCEDSSIGKAVDHRIDRVGSLVELAEKALASRRISTSFSSPAFGFKPFTRARARDTSDLTGVYPILRHPVVIKVVGDPPVLGCFGDGLPRQH